MNQSQSQQRICDAEENIKNLWKKCQDLTDNGTDLDSKIDKTRAELDGQHDNFHREYKKTMGEHEDKFTNQGKKIRTAQDLLEQHTKLHEQAAMFRE